MQLVWTRNRTKTIITDGDSSAIVNNRQGKLISLVKQHERWFSESLPLVASENVASRTVRQVLSSDLGHRYAEGWPGERVYAGCKFIDQIELEAISLAKTLFNAEFADVRPVSGACANLAVYSALSDPGDTMMALSIQNGGHISAGKKEFSGTAGLVHGLAHPGHNITGLTFLAPELVGKRLALLKEAAPATSQVAVMATASHPGEQSEWRAWE